MNQKNNADIIVVGGGASGMTAAIIAARAGSSVMILEHMDMAGKKILATGNGKCNYTNEMQGAENYRGDNPAFVMPVLQQFDWKDTVSFFRELGIYPKVKQGYYYPASEQAASLREVLLLELARLDVTVVYGCGIRSIQKENDCFLFDTKQGSYHSSRCIIACGGKASKVTGSDGSGYLYVERLGHHIIYPVPALVQLQGQQSFFKRIAGIRADAVVDLYVDNTLAATDRGELQLTDYGISGIPVFQVSRYATRALAQKQEVHAVLDFFPSLSDEEFLDMLRARLTAMPYKTISEAFIGLFNQKLVPVFLELSKVRPELLATACGEAQYRAIAKVIKHFFVTIVGAKGFDHAQTTAGGVDTEEIHNNTLESRLIEGLYFAGEIIDIDGQCGGYNLQWAWSSGYVAGLHAARQDIDIVSDKVTKG